MNYEEFRTAVCTLTGGFEKDWDVIHDWGTPPVNPVTGEAANSDAAMEMEYDYIVLEKEEGMFYAFYSFPVKPLFNLYQKEGWDVACRELLKHLPDQKKESGVVDYGAKLNEEGKKLYETLRSLRARIAATKQVPPYVIFTNRTLYEMCCSQPATMEELLEVFGVGEKNSKEYGQQFLDEITEFTDGKKKNLEREEAGSLEDYKGPVVRPMFRGVIDPEIFKD